MVGTCYIHSSIFRGITRIVADRARVPIIGVKYGLPPYFARYASSIRLLIEPSTASKNDFFRDACGANAAGSLPHGGLVPTRLLTVVASDV